MVAEGKPATEKAASTTATPEPPDPRIVEMVVAMVPPGIDQKSKEEQKGLIEQIQKLVEGAQKKQADAAKAPDEKDLKDAEARFFSGDVQGAEARKQEEEDQQKQSLALAAAYKAAGQSGPPKGSAEEKAAAGQQGYSHTR